MSDEVKEFYDSFLDKTMISYRIYGNSRIDAAHAFASGHLAGRKLIADIGCGIGIFAERVGNELPNARIIAVDLSEKNITYAKKTVEAGNIQFSAASVTDQFSVVRNLAGGPIDAFCMIDVMEHIPEDARPSLLQDMAEIASDDAVLILTYPSPEYIRHLTVMSPDQLQIIDNAIDIAVLIGEAEHAGWRLREFRYVGVWHHNEYIHAAFGRRFDLSEKKVPATFLARVRNVFDRLVLQPRRIKRYDVKRDGTTL